MLCGVELLQDISGPRVVVDPELWDDLLHGGVETGDVGLQVQFGRCKFFWEFLLQLVEGLNGYERVLSLVKLTDHTEPEALAVPVPLDVVPVLRPEASLHDRDEALVVLGDAALCHGVVRGDGHRMMR